MTKLFLIRHATNDWVKTGKLAGWTPGVHLNEYGKAQAEAIGTRLASAKIHAIYSSPLERTLETAAAIVQHHPKLTVQPIEEVGEVRYGQWEGAELKKLYRQKRWRYVQMVPSRVRFPDGETLRGAQARAVEVMESLCIKHPGQTVAVVSHSDVIRMTVAYYLGVHLDLFQRIVISPASLTILSMGAGMPFIECVNDTSHIPKEEPKSD
ncbi:MAG: MSMEG_4193 family putative phosphomutase [Anaerolineae bacterium]|nr:MSMEG_4193 family putative phosphomutase [Anaerolineae bacterium]